MSTNHGTFVWYEVMTSDTSAAESFYRSVVGWNIKDAGMEGFAYQVVSVGPTMIGGMMAIPEAARTMGAQAAWLGYIGVDDVDIHTGRVTAAGGAVHRAPEDIPGVGRFAIVADPQGAVFILFRGSSDQAPQAVAPGTSGHVGWHELHAGDGVSAFAFYADLFGWTKGEAIDMGPMGVYQIFAAGGVPVGGMMTKSADMPMPAWLYYFNVEAVDAAMGRVRDSGGTVVLEPQQVPGGMWIVQCIDPQGAMFAMLGAKR